MIPEQCKDKVYFSKWLRTDYPDLYQAIVNILDAHHVDHDVLALTKDYWCRDYMPIQWGHQQYAQFVYDPDYIQEPEKYRTDTSQVLKYVQEAMTVLNQSPLRLDGGNMVFCEGGRHPDNTNYVVMTEKVLVDNPTYSRTEIEQLIQQALIRPGWVNTGLHIVWVPWDPSDTCGHTDGMLHYVGVNAAGKPIVLVHLDVYDDEYAAQVYEILSQHFEVVKLRLSHPNEHSWAYVNMLHMRDVMIVPGIGDEVTDRKAFEQIRALFPQYEGRIYQVQMQKLVARWGGALNCCTWTISREMSSVVHSATNAAKYEALVAKAEADEQNLTPDEMIFLGDYAPLQLERISHFIDNYYCGW
jgi:hypothetical protein